MNKEELQQKIAQEWVQEMAARVQEMVQEDFFQECKEFRRALNMAVLAESTVLAGARIMCAHCPEEQLPRAAQFLVGQIGAAIQEGQEEKEPLPQGVNGEAANDELVQVEGLVPGHVERKVGDPEHNPEE